MTMITVPISLRTRLARMALLWAGAARRVAARRGQG
jgi:hypothetical protein